MEKQFGIDVSSWQKNYPYEKAISEGVKFVIIRAGYSTKKDSQFETHYKRAKELGLKVGAYWFSYASNASKAETEARAFLKAVEGKQFELPLYMDVESSTIQKASKSDRNAGIEAFAKIIENAGYYFAVYTNTNWYNNLISGSELNKKYDWWIAQWSKSAPSSNIKYGVWQFGGESNSIRSNKIGGVITDQNYCYKDYESIMKKKGLNGFKKSEVSVPVIETPVIEEPPVVEEPIIEEPIVIPPIEEPVIETPIETPTDDKIIKLIEAIIKFIKSLLKK